ncbi:MAG: transcription termination/antitermination NusG family protein [Pseudomonadota bacterium]
MSTGVKKASKIAPEIELLSSFVGRYPLNWYIAYCNPRCERRAFRGLMDKGILAWLPEQDVERKQPKTKRKFTVRMPIFTRYIFVGVDPLRRQSVGDVRTCDGIEGLVKIEETGVPYQVSADSLVPLFKRVYDDNKIKAGSRFKIGEFLEITAGAFAGFSFEVSAVEEDRQIIHGDVEIFGRQTQVTLPVDDVKIPA